MGIEYALVDDDRKQYAGLGKKFWTEDGPTRFQMDPVRVSKFLAGCHAGVRMITDSGDEYYELPEKGYVKVDAWHVGLDDDEKEPK